MEERTVGFSDLKLMPGQLMQLEFESYTEDRDKAVLIGYRANQSLIISHPVISDVSAAIKSSQRVNVRFFANRVNGVCAFSTEVLHVSKVPYPHIHLAMPEEVMLGEVRRCLRADVEIITHISYIIEGESLSTTGKIVDLSVDGARMLGRSFDFKVGANVRLTFKINITGIECELDINSAIRSIQEIETGYSVGIQFVSVEPQNQIALQAFVLSVAHNF